jgi:predicted enzyme related to lactoylglutathione lyase
MTVIATHAPGTFCWADLGTTDTAAAKRFYTGLFGWSFEDRPMAGDEYYTMLELRGKHVGALYPQQEDERTAGIPPHWLCYIAVDSADKAAARAAELGGTVLAPPFDVLDAGRMSIIRDPEGAVVALWEARNHPGAGVLGEPGAMCWHELATRDTARAGDFYGALLGWTRETMPMEKFTYTVFRRGEQMAGGMMPIMAEWGAMPPNWGVYFAADDVDASAARAEELGGKICSPPTDIPGVGRFAVIQDPQGAMFSLFRPLHP